MRFLWSFLLAFASCSLATRTEEAAYRAVRPVAWDVWESTSFDPGEAVGVFVGVGVFTKDDQIADVSYAVDDAVDLAHLLSLEIGLLKPERALLLISGVPQKAETAERLRALRNAGAPVASATRSDLFIGLFNQAREAGPNGLLIVSFATHGVVQRGVHYLMAEDSLSWRREDTGFPSHYVFEALGKAEEVPRRILLLDACREQLLETERRDARDSSTAIPQVLIDAMAQARGQVILSAAPFGGYAFGNTKRGNGVFTGAVLDGLRGAAASDQRGFVTISTLATYVNEAVREWIQREVNAPSWEPGIEMNLSGPVLDLPLTVLLTRRLDLCDGISRPATCKDTTFTIKVHKFWEHGEMVSFDLESPGVGSIRIGATPEAAIRRFSLGGESCAIRVLAVAEPCSTVIIEDND